LTKHSKGKKLISELIPTNIAADHDREIALIAIIALLSVSVYASQLPMAAFANNKIP